MTDTLYQEHLEDELTRYKDAEAQDMDCIAWERAQLKRELTHQQHSFHPPDTRLCNPHDLIFIQSRAEMNFELVDEYAEMMGNGVTFDPCEGVETTEGNVYVWDGFHRGESAKKNGSMLLVRIEKGTQEEAEWKAFGANIKHGLRRTRRDIERAVKHALKHPNGARLSNREIARHCGCDDKTVGKYRKELEASAEIPQMQTRDITRTTASGETQTYQIEMPGAETYYTIPELEGFVRGYLGGGRKERINYLQNIAQKTVAGNAYLREIEKGLLQGKEKRYRKTDLLKAVRNLRDALLQIQCSGTVEGQPCEFIGTETQMFEHNGKWYCAKCFQKIQQAQKEQQPHGDPADLDNIILQKIEGLTPEYRVKLLKKILFEDSALENLAQQIPGFPPKAIRERCKLLYERVTLASCHKAKGLEWERVFVMKWKNELVQFPHPRVRGPEFLQQEMNLLFVAVTRARNELHYFDYKEDFS